MSWLLEMYKFDWIMQLPSRFLGQRGIFLCDYKHQDFQFSPDGKLAKFGDSLFLILLINYFWSHTDPIPIYDPTSTSFDPTYQLFLIIFYFRIIFVIQKSMVLAFLTLISSESSTRFRRGLSWRTSLVLFVLIIQLRFTTFLLLKILKK